MIGGFKSRKPWAAVIIALLLGPSIGCFYLNKGKLGLYYLAFTILAAIASFAGAQFDIINTHPIEVINVVSTVLQIIGAIHCFLIAKWQTYTTPMKWYSRWYAWLAIIPVIMILAAVFRHYGYEPFYIPASSMSPNVNKGDYLFVEKFAYNHSLPSRGDVVVFKVNNICFIKRVIGLPGDKVQIKDRLLYINDFQVPRKQIEDYRSQDHVGKKSAHQFIEILPEGKEVKVLDESLSAAFDNTQVYNVPADHYFVLGDNRDNSRDSRDQQGIGYVPLESITGRASVILWNYNAKKLMSKPIDAKP
ncbi:MAG: signal peptidase I [Pseudomonadota bacterium]